MNGLGSLCSSDSLRSNQRFDFIQVIEYSAAVPVEGETLSEQSIFLECSFRDARECGYV